MYQGIFTKQMQAAHDLSQSYHIQYDLQRYAAIPCVYIDIGISVGVLCPTLASVLEEGKEAPMHKVFPCALMTKLGVSFKLFTTIPHHHHHIFSGKNMHFPPFNAMFIHFPICFSMITIFFYSDSSVALFQSPSPRLVRRLMTLSSRLGTGKTKVSISKSLRFGIAWLQLQ